MPCMGAYNCQTSSKSKPIIVYVYMSFIKNCDGPEMLFHLNSSVQQRRRRKINSWMDEK